MQAPSSGFHSFGNCSARVEPVGFCPVNGRYFADGVYPVTSSQDEGPPESDLGPWWIFLFLGRSIVRGVRWLTG